jgi:hypothetical protein
MLSTGSKYLILLFFYENVPVRNCSRISFIGNSVMLGKARLDFYKNVDTASFLLANPFFFFFSSC